MLDQTDSIASRHQVRPAHPAPLGYRGVGSRLLSLVAALWICFSSLAWAQEASGTSGLDQAPSVRLDPATEVLAYISCREGWRPIDAGSLAKGQEFQHAGRLCRIGADGAVEADADVDLALLPESDRIYERGRARSPLPIDVVRFVDADFRHSRHDRVESAGAGDRFFFQGRLYEVEQGSEGPSREVWRDTGIVLSRVTRTFRSETDALVDLKVVDGSGRESVISGTPEHPFFVPAVNDYVPMSALESGTVLKTLDGAMVTVKSAAVRREDASVYNFEVEGTHSYFASSVDCGPMLDVHNVDCIPPRYTGRSSQLTLDEFHGANQKISRGIKTSEVLDATRTGKVIRQYDEAMDMIKFRFEGKNGVTVVLDEYGDLITAFRGR